MRIGILTSGGDAPGMNPAIRAVVRTAIYYGIEVYGIRDGYQGLIDGEIYNMEASSVGDIIQRGGTILGTDRSDEFRTPEGLQRALNVLDVFKINSLVVMGGDGSLKGAKTLSDNGINVVGIPCTIDNDLGFTDYTIGFWTAIETAMEAIGRLRDTSNSHGRASVVEVMGRDSGDLALYAALAGGGESIVVPEMPLDIDKIIKKAMEGRLRGKKQNLVIVAEGMGDTYEIARKLKEKTGIETRVTVLGHVQRGGGPGAYDRVLASMLGRRAVEVLRSQEGAYAVGVKDNEYYTVDLEEALKIEAEFDSTIYDTIGILSI